MQNNDIFTKQVNLKLLIKVQKLLTNIDHPNISYISKQILLNQLDKINRIPLKDIIKDLKSDKPIEYILKKANFLDLVLYVDKNVLIPRVETEELVKIAIQKIKSVPKFDKKISIIDIGTGSGAIIISLAKEFGEKYSYYATDISKEAIKIAKLNAKRYRLDKMINFSQTDGIRKISSNINIIISNPPYIPSKQIENLHVSVKDFEPIKALDGGPDGLNIYKKINTQIENNKIRFEYLLFEIDPLIAKPFKELFSNNMYKTKILKDQNSYQRYAIITNKKIIQPQPILR